MRSFPLLLVLSLLAVLGGTKAQLDVSAAVQTLLDNVPVVGQKLPTILASWRRFRLSLHDLVVKEVKWPRVRALYWTSTNRIVISSVSGGSLATQGNWWLKKLRRRRLRNRGSGRCYPSASNVRISISGTYTNGKLSVTSCSSSIGDVRLKLRGHWLSWFYNAILRLCKRKVTSSVNSKVCSIIRSKFP